MENLHLYQPAAPGSIGARHDKIEWLNPNSLYRLSLRIGYPNAFDWEMVRLDGRVNFIASSKGN
ncbi:MAG: hypothetical protein NTV93_08520 [Verrucomicrobia bacterium]|nr:hypothetical protein [Verrucomicrobiota bacterium]